ncbi:MAG: hypothetical protein ACO1Q7_15910 [Gemmatimonas sp.]
MSVEAFLRRVRVDTDRELRAVSLLLQREIQQELSKPGTGRLYRRRKARYGPVRANGTRRRMPSRVSDFHRASAPGNPPAPDTNTLKRSIYTEKAGEMLYHVGAATDYAERLNTTMNRPFMEKPLNRWMLRVGARP